MKSQNPQNGGLGANLRLLFHKPTGNLSYTLYWDSKVVPAAPLSPQSPLSSTSQQSQKHSVKDEIPGKKVIKVASSHYHSHYGCPGKGRAENRLFESWKTENGLSMLILKRKGELTLPNQKSLQNDEERMTMELLVKTGDKNSKEPQFQLTFAFQWHRANCHRPISWCRGRDLCSFPIHRFLTPPLIKPHTQPVLLMQASSSGSS